MKQYTVEEIKEILELHAKWWRGEPGGKRADLSGADLSGADLSGAVLSGADLRNADLRNADLSGADLNSAVLSGADLRNVVLSGAVLSGAVLRNADLSGAVLSEIIHKHSIVPEYGAFNAYKKLANGCVALLYIPKSAQRLGGLLGRKCRVSKAKVKMIWNIVDNKEVLEGTSQHDSTFKYKVGEWVKPTLDFNQDVREECTSGIHIFLTKREAEEY